jgi:hypothetical protein
MSDRWAKVTEGLLITTLHIFQPYSHYIEYNAEFEADAEGNENSEAEAEAD